MESTMVKPRDVAIPAASFSALRRALHEEVGPLVAVHALRSAGYEAGATLFDAFSRDGDGGDPAGLGRPAFFRRLGRFLGARGWGSLDHDTSHPGVGLLISPDWAESAGVTGATEPVCAYSSGMLSALLTQAAGAPVAVVQVQCRALGDETCTFAFGSEDTVNTLYDLVADDGELASALARL